MSGKVERLAFHLASVQCPEHGGCSPCGAGAAAGMKSTLPYERACLQAAPAAGDESESCHINILAA